MHQLSRAAGWINAVQANGAHIWYTGAGRTIGEPRCFPLGDEGAILGWLADSDAQVALPEGTVERIARTDGRELIETKWGDYIAFVRPRSADSIHIIKDPVGDLPCHCTRHGDLYLFFSCIADLVHLLHFVARIEERYLVQRILSGGADAKTHPLQQIWPVHRGECITLRDAGDSLQLKRQFYWHPDAFTEPAARIDDVSCAATQLHDTVSCCTRAALNGHHHVLHRLSGGLDSTIIAACLSQARPDHHIHCYTYFDLQARNDERRWARIAAEHFGLPHLEQACDGARVRLSDLGTVQPSVGPVFLMSALERGRLERALATELQASAVFTGLGGDSVFGGDSIGLTALEFLRHHGPSLEFIRIAARIARYSDRSLWNVLARSLRRWLLASRMKEDLAFQSEASTLAEPSLREPMRPQQRYPHPWFDQRAEIPWCTIRRLGALLYPPQHYDVLLNLDASVPVIRSPLYAQPVVELLLRVPQYLLFDGRERGLARHAFVQELPAAIYERQWKDRATGYFDTLIENNRDYLRELLMEGRLAQRGLLDRRRVDAALSSGLTRTHTLPGEILRHMDTEIWLRTWDDVARAATPHAQRPLEA